MSRYYYERPANRPETPQAPFRPARGQTTLPMFGNRPSVPQSTPQPQPPAISPPQLFSASQTSSGEKAKARDIIAAIRTNHLPLHDIECTVMLDAN